MHLLGRCPYTEIELCWDCEVTGPAETRAGQLRGALASAFADDDLFHQHATDGQPLYRYPQVQYRWRKGHGLVVGWQAAAERLLQLPWLDLNLQLGNVAVGVADVRLVAHHANFDVSQRLHHYRFVSPALLFNQKNYPVYRAMAAAEQQAERDRLLVASLLMALRGLKIDFSERLYATFTHFSEQPCHYKQQGLIGLRGGFVCNAGLPDGLGIGRAVSHGYGWLVASKPQESR